MKHFYLILTLIFIFSCSKQRMDEYVIFDFETDAELDMLQWECYTSYSLSKEHVSSGNNALKIEMFPSLYPGFKPVLVFHDWHQFKMLCIDAYNPAKTGIEVVVRIDDKKGDLAYTDRYNKRYNLSPGPNRIRIPVHSIITSGTNRNLNLRNIRRFIIFMVNPERKYTLYLDNIRLAR